MFSLYKDSSAEAAKFKDSRWYRPNASPPGIYPNCGPMEHQFAANPIVPPAPHEACRPNYEIVEVAGKGRAAKFTGWQTLVKIDSEGRVLTGNTNRSGVRLSAYRSESMFPDRSGSAVRHVYKDRHGKKSWIEVSDGSDDDSDFRR